MKDLNLMIGDWVTDEYWDSFKTPIKVESINDKGINLIIHNDGNFSECASTWIAPEYFTWDKIRGIPLTPDILKNIGFNYDLITYYLGDIMLSECDDGFTCWYKHFGESNRLPMVIPHLHTLQQLIRLFTNKEIEIKW